MPPLRRKPMEPNDPKALLFRGTPEQYAEVVRKADEDRRKKQGKK